MRNEIYQEIRDCTDLPSVREGVIRVFQTVKETTGAEKIGYVAGIITSDGPDHVEQNITRLHEFTEVISTQVSYPVFSAVDVFSNGMFDMIEEMELVYEVREQHFQNFWRGILGSGHVTDIFLTPRWKESRGATDEFQTATTLGIEVHDLEEMGTL